MSDRGGLARKLLYPAAMFGTVSKGFAVAVALICAPAFAYSSGITGRSQQGCGSCHGGGGTPTVSLSGPSSVTAGSSNQYTLTISGGNGGGAGLDVSINGGSLSISGSDGPDEYTSGGEICNSQKGPMSGSSIAYTFHVTAGSGSSMTIYAAGLSGSSEGNSGYSETSQTITIGSASPPTVQTPASASPSTLTGAGSTSLSVLGASSQGESSLTYTWSSTPAGVTFSPNGTNAAKNTTASFSSVGTYTLTVTIKDSQSQTVTSQTQVTVNQAGANAPQITQAASAAGNPVTSTSVGVNVAASDPSGTGLTYTWSASGVSFSPNGSASASSSQATFSAAGNYTLVVTVTNSAGSTQSSVPVQVVSTPAGISVGPQSPTVQAGGVQAFTASGVDQFGSPISSPTVTWSATGDGSIDGSGNFTAGSGAGTATVTATSGAQVASTTVTVVTGVTTVGNTSVQWLQPTGGADLSGLVTLRAVAMDPGGIASVAFGVDGTTLTTVTTPSYEMTWDSTTFKDGQHSLTATATSLSGTQATTTLLITTNNAQAANTGGCTSAGGLLPGLAALAALLRRRRTRA